jgi:hypothetical protein
MIRLAVGARDLDSLRDWTQRARLEWQGRPAVPLHTKRMPTRTGELLDGGSLYWVVKGAVRCRVPLVGFEMVEDGEGDSWCRFYVAPELVEVSPRPMRPFQGWRYLKPADAPPDVGAPGTGEGELPAHILAELRELGLA